MHHTEVRRYQMSFASILLRHGKSGRKGITEPVASRKMPGEVAKMEREIITREDRESTVG